MHSPIQMKRHTMEFLREKAHLRFRTSTFNAVFRLRHGLQFAIHEYFNQNGFNMLHTPIVTGSDAEGAGEMFQVTTLDLNDGDLTKDNTEKLPRSVREALIEQGITDFSQFEDDED